MAHRDYLTAKQMKMVQLFWSFEHLLDGGKKYTIEIGGSAVRLWRDD